MSRRSMKYLKTSKAHIGQARSVKRKRGNKAKKASIEMAANAAGMSQDELQAERKRVAALQSLKRREVITSNAPPPPMSESWLNPQLGNS